MNTTGAIVAIAALLVTTIPSRAEEPRQQQWHLDFLHIQEAHKITKGAGTVVAVVDTGVQIHPDLEGNVLPGATTNGHSVEDGQVDLSGHGTAMAGLIAAHGREGRGALGIAPEAKILPVATKVNDDTIGQKSIAQGIGWSIAHNADVINISSGGNPSVELRAAIESAIEADAVIVAASGNRPNREVGFPAAYPGVLAVGAVGRDGALAALSVSGEALAITAPGEEIMTTRLAANYGVGSGTSDAAAIVSGAAALVRSRFPELSAKEVVHRLTATAVDKGAPGRDKEYGYGVLNLVGALADEVPPPTPTGGQKSISEAAATTSPTAANSGPERDGGLTRFAVVTVALTCGAVVGLVVWGRARRRRRG